MPSTLAGDMSLSQIQLEQFHPAVAQWFGATFDTPSLPQVRGWPAIRSGRNTLIAAPTGSGKTLAAFLCCIDDLMRQGLDGGLPAQTQVLYISPLKSLSNDVQKNLAEPLEGISAVLREAGHEPPEVRVMVRTGDTPQSQRQSMARKPPHILVTTPESLFILLTSGKGRSMLRTVKTVIVDEIHAVARDKRGSHLALSLQRLDALTDSPAVRIGLSATQRPIEELARFLVGADNQDDNGTPYCHIVDEGHRRHMELSIELPGTPLASVCSNETWEDIYDRIAQLIEEQRTTLVFVNTRRLAERLTFHLARRLGEALVTSHHGSLSREQRLSAEQKLKAGELRALVATASLELGIDIGTVDLVCQIGSPRSISSFLQRVGRSGHTMQATPKGKLFALTRDELVECSALLACVRQGDLDRLSIPEKPLDILAQQIVASAAQEEWQADDLFQLFRGAHPYRNLERSEFDQVVTMLAEGYARRNGRGGARIFYDGVGKRIKGRRGASIAAQTSGGAIPDNADYTVVLEPQGTLVGTLNEDFAIESMPGDIFQLGISSWRILRVESGVVRVEDAHGLPPTIPFWLGEAPARTAELSSAVSRLREQVDALLEEGRGTVGWLVEEGGLTLSAAEQLSEYLAAEKKALGVIPSQNTIVLERFNDEAGGMQLVVHSPFGGRINRAWGLALRKRFCRTFNFELQAAANEDAIVLSLGPQHSFPLDEVFSYLREPTVEPVLVQALLAAPMFATRWRWNAMRALAILRQEGSRRVPHPLLRMRSDDLLTSVFPDQMACPENLAGDVKLPDHPLVQQTVKDCLTEAMDIDGFRALLQSMESGKLKLVARDTLEPSPFCHEILNVKPYAFLDDAPLEERRTQAVLTRRTLDVQPADGMADLDPEAILRVREEAWPAVEDDDELHDALLLLGFVTEVEMVPWQSHLPSLVAQGRVGRIAETGQPFWFAAERAGLVRALFFSAPMEPMPRAIPEEAGRPYQRDEALVELVRARLEGLGPVTAADIAGPLGVDEGEVSVALLALERRGSVIRGRFAGRGAIEFCDRRLLARIQRYTLDRLRQQIEPVSAADFMRFLFVWQHAHPDQQLEGPLGLVAVLEQLQGFHLPAAAWEWQILQARLRRYDPAWLDHLCLSGELAWGRLLPSSNPEGRSSGLIGSVPVTLMFREKLSCYAPALDEAAGPRLSAAAKQVLDHLTQRGASFLQDLARHTGRLPAQVEKALGELVAQGLVTGDGFEGLRGLLKPSRDRTARGNGRVPGSYSRAFQPSRAAPGRWSLFQQDLDGIDGLEGNGTGRKDRAAEGVARQLLARYGIVFHRLLLREEGLPPYRELLKVYRRLEARGEVRGGRFVAGFSGEQYALPEAVQQVRAARRSAVDGMHIVISAADPLNLAGITSPGQRVPAIASNRVVYCDGVPVAARVGKEAQSLLPSEPTPSAEARQALAVSLQNGHKGLKGTLR